MFWNHRVVRIVENNEPLLLIAEVSYDSDTKKPFAYTEPFMCSEDMVGLTKLTGQLAECLLQPVLNYPEDFDLREFTDEDEEDEDDTVTGAPV